MDREKLRREAVRQLRRMASGAPVEELRITQREDGSPELELAGIDPYQLSGVKLGKNGVELSFTAVWRPSTGCWNWLARRRQPAGRTGAFGVEWRER